MNAPVTRAAEGLDRRAFTIADVERMVEVGVISPDERLEIVGGEIVPMSPKGSRHEAIKAALALCWGKRCPDGYAFAVETGLRLDESTYLEPDLVVFSRRVKLADLRGADVLLAVEVADSSRDYDLKRKPGVHATHGVRELWVIDAAQRVAHVHLAPGKGQYSSTAARKSAERLEPTHAPMEFAFALDDLEPL
ncbi:MAG: Uma2 family endonuclease [Propylenella sp.]